MKMESLVLRVALVLTCTNASVINVHTCNYEAGTLTCKMWKTDVYGPDRLLSGVVRLSLEVTKPAKLERLDLFPDLKTIDVHGECKMLQITEVAHVRVECNKDEIETPQAFPATSIQQTAIHSLTPTPSTPVSASGLTRSNGLAQPTTTIPTLMSTPAAQSTIMNYCGIIDSLKAQKLHLEIELLKIQIRKLNA